MGMRTATLLAFAVILVALGGTAAFAFQSGGDDVQLQERWTSDTGREARSNHHAPAAGSVNGTGMVYAPVSGRSGLPNCALYGLYSENGSARWEYQVAKANCTIHSVANPTIADYDSDGVREVLTTSTEQAVLGFTAESGTEELRANLTGYGYTQPVVTDLLGDGTNETITVDVRGTVFVFRPNGSVVWSTRLNSYTWGQPGVADFDDDGRKEVVVGISDGSLTMFERNGSVVWEKQDLLGGSILWVATGQADEEPGEEIVVATNRGKVALIDGADGEVQWVNEFGAFAAVHAFGDGDGDGEPEIYAVARDAELRSIDAASGEVEWTTTLTSADVQMTPPPTLGDVDGDGAQELVAVTNDGKIAVVDPQNGAVLDTYSRDVTLYTHPEVADTDGDGAAEIYVMYSDGRVVALEAAGDES